MTYNELMEMLEEAALPVAYTILNLKHNIESNVYR